LLVLQAVRRNNIAWYVAALLWHTLLDAVAVFGISTWGVYVTEGIVFGMALVSLGIVFALRKTDAPQEPEMEIGGDPTPVPVLEQAEPVEITAETLEESRYD
jgi:hypothetical protein